MVRRQPSSTYGLEMPTVLYVPFEAARVAEPPVDRSPVLLMNALPEELRDSYSSVEHLLLLCERVPPDMDDTCRRFGHGLGPRRPGVVDGGKIGEI